MNESIGNCRLYGENMICYNNAALQKWGLAALVVTALILLLIIIYISYRETRLKKEKKSEEGKHESR